MNQNAMKA